ncbi:hypothetical protein SteCoe_36950 [Stentor coeruleus]|uniref:RING-type domain-containing protein n=1 Tax=Stentor coeruleus TaxID=5963 RepID=A0A1R2AP56_9CILI|nr:hypothetical protein SteCoe_36950 [Stentor coeruleus]
MLFLNFFFYLAYGIIYINRTFYLEKSPSEHKFQLTKAENTKNMLFMISIDKYPTFEFLPDLDDWEHSVDYYDARGWIINSDSLLISVPGDKSGIAYAAVFTEDKNSLFQIEESAKSPSLCLFVCKNGGVCKNGMCICSKDYGGVDCGIKMNNEKGLLEFQVASMEWAFYKVKFDGEIFVKARALSKDKYRIFISSGYTGNEIPTMLNSKSYSFPETKSYFSFKYKDSNAKIIIMSIYCYAPSLCSGSINLLETISKSITWVIIFCSIVGSFVMISIPLGFLYCKRARAIQKIKIDNISKEQMEIMFPNFTYDKNKLDACLICFEVMFNRSCRELCCSHIYHVDCIDQWAITNLACPVCKQGMIAEYLETKRQKEIEKLDTEQYHDMN